MPFKNLILKVIDSFWSTLSIGQFKNKFMPMIKRDKARISPAFIRSESPDCDPLSGQYC